MIATLFGEVSDKLLDRVILDVGGVGYELFTCSMESSEITPKGKVKLFVYEHIKEDAYDLYGFTNQDTLALFKQLLSVKNIGPKAALSILSSAKTDSIKEAIAGGDVNFLMAAKGVGKRAAEQVIVELRDKVGLESTADKIVARRGLNPTDEAFQALLSLGYTESDAAAALADIDQKLPVSERVKLALKGSSK